MPMKIARSTPRPSFGLRELLVASPYLPSGFQGRCKIATLHAGFGVIRGMSDKTNAQACSGVCWVRAVEPLDLDAHKKFWIPISVPDVPRTSNRLLKI